MTACLQITDFGLLLRRSQAASRPIWGPAAATEDNKKMRLSVFSSTITARLLLAAAASFAKIKDKMSFVRDFISDGFKIGALFAKREIVKAFEASKQGGRFAKELGTLRLTNSGSPSKLQ